MIYTCFLFFLYCKDKAENACCQTENFYLCIEEIYDLIERFANYGFNRSHGFAYGALAFQIAYFKAHFPDEFYEIQLRDRKREVMILDALENGFEIEKPSINLMKIGDFVQKSFMNQRFLYQNRG